MKFTRSVLVSLSLAALAACVSSGGSRPPTDEQAAIANMNLGIGYLRQGRPDAAVDALERATDLNPRLADAHSALALAYDETGEPERAEEHYRVATQLDLSNGSAQNLYAVFLCRQNRWNEAERYFERAASTPSYPTPAAALANAGGCARAAGDLAKAEQNYRAALAIDPAFPDALGGMIELSVENENFLQARAFIQRSFNTNPPSSRQLWLCAYAERQLNDLVAAENCAQQLRSTFPNSPEIQQLRELERNAGS